MGLQANVKNNSNEREQPVPSTDTQIRKRDEENLRMSEERYRTLADSLPEIVFETDFNGKLTYLNKKAFEITGYTQEDFNAGAYYFSFFAPYDVERAKLNFGKAMVTASSTKNEYDLIKKDRTTFPTLIEGIPLMSDGKVVGMCGIVIDLTERKIVEESLKRQANLIDLSPSAIIIKNLNETITFWSHGAEKLYGFTKQEAIGQRINDLLKTKYPKPANEIIAQLQQGKHWIGEATHYTKENKEVIVQADWLATLDNNGKIIEILESNVDITAHKRAEEEALKMAEDRYLKAERLAAIGQLAGMVGHDLRNPLAGIKNAVYLLRKKQGNFIGESGKMMLDTIDQAVEHSDSIISDMLDYSREIHLQLEEYSTKSLINYVILSLKIPKNIKILERTQDANIWLDANKLQRVFVNLVKNSFDAMPNGGQLEISSHQEGENYSFIFADTGSGMSEEVIAKIFTPLFTTKAQGMGLGLVICKRFIDAHNGKISVQSIQNQGTTFKVSLPIHSNYICDDNRE